MNISALSVYLTTGQRRQTSCRCVRRTLHTHTHTVGARHKDNISLESRISIDAYEKPKPYLVTGGSHCGEWEAMSHGFIVGVW